MHGSVNDVVKAAEVSFVYPVMGQSMGESGEMYFDKRNLHKKGTDNVRKAIKK